MDLRLYLLTRLTGYALKVTIGNPGKLFTVLLKSGNSVFWVADSDCAYAFCANKQKYIPSQSTTSKGSTSEKTFFFVGSEESVFGINWNDDIIMERMDGRKVKFPNSIFGTPTYVSWFSWREYEKIDGAFGITFPDINNTFNDNPIKEAIRNNIIPAIITVALPPQRSNAFGSLTLGEIDKNLCIEKEQIPEMVSGNRLTFRYLSLSMGIVTFSSSFKTATAYIHTTKAYINVPEELMQDIVQYTNAQMNESTQNYMVNCNELFEPLEITTTHNTYSIQPENFIYKQNRFDKQCVLAIRSEKSAFDRVTLGIPFLNQYCAVMEPNAHRITFLPMTTNFMQRFVNSA
ncbi:unnamed protein product [Thelazia callipaeda]|uniref:Peptidase A1 domain-containing protein n=1 Tax=Thelazia callipaeda TaxID=103827 RepID=A0A0N5CKU6_THECL|nr:unnamed protein product [Thelazia callipaeda]